MDIQYTGEWLAAGIAGRALIWLSLLGILGSAIMYLLATKTNPAKRALVRTGDWLFGIHAISLTGAIAVLYFLIINHRFEFAYVWQYSGYDMPGKFLISCFWAGQEGSYLIWAFFQAITGLILLRSAAEWKPYVMPVFITGQLFLLFMVLGFKLGPVTLGGSPFELLRNQPQNQGADLFKMPDYLQYIEDGNGLNPLLENVWMIIHPPMLFLGYALTLVPFSYVLAALRRNEYRSWLREGILWTLASILILGVGIILGGRWAYESLTFGGFWAWDPVENASLVPWLMMVAALHMLLIARRRFNSHATAFLFLIFGWFFVVYATYLTRSGVLGATSVHSFGENVLSTQMVVFCLIFLIVPLALLFIRRKSMPRKDADLLLSREFWMLIGSILAVLSAFQVISTTSIPVINKVLGTDIAPPTDSVTFYNRWQLPFAVLVTFIIALSQYLRYGANELKMFIKKLLLAVGISVLLTAGMALIGMVHGFPKMLLLFTVMLSLVASVQFLLQYAKHTTNLAGSLTHIGFALFLTGVILAFGNQQVISLNTNTARQDVEESNDESIVLDKHKPQPMGDYMVTYNDAKTKGNDTYFRVDFIRKKDFADSIVAFSLYPSLKLNSKMGNVYNPDTRHYLNKDIYTYLNFAQPPAENPTPDGYAKKREEQMLLKDTVIYNRSFVVLDSIGTIMKGNDVNNASITAYFNIMSMQHGTMQAKATFAVRDGKLEHTDAIVGPMNLKIVFENVSENSKAIKVGFYEKQQDYIVMKAIVFPFISVMWTGIILMFSGLTYAILRRRQKYNQGETTQAQPAEGPNPSN